MKIEEISLELTPPLVSFTPSQFAEQIKLLPNRKAPGYGYGTHLLKTHRKLKTRNWCCLVQSFLIPIMSFSKNIITYVDCHQHDRPEYKFEEEKKFKYWNKMKRENMVVIFENKLIKNNYNK